MKGTKMPSQREKATWASGLNKELVIDNGFVHVSALLNDGKPNSCCFRSPAKLGSEPWGLQTGISDLLWNQTLLQLLQTRSFSADLQQRAVCNNCADRCCSLPFTPAWGWCISQTLNPKEAHLAAGWAKIDKYYPCKSPVRREVKRVHLGWLQTFGCLR